VANSELSTYLTPKVILNYSLLVGFFIFIGAIVSFLGGEIRSSSDSLSSNRTEIDRRIKVVSNIAELRGQTAEVDTAIVELRKVIPERNQIFSFPRYLEGLASQSSVAIGFNFSGDTVESTNSSAGNNDFRVSIRGNYSDVIGFIDKLEQGTFLVNLESIDVTKLDTEFSAGVGGKVYFYE